MVLAAIASLLVALLAWAVLRQVPISPRVVDGWAQPNGAGTSISLHDSPDGGLGEGYVIAGADWRQVGKPWNSGAVSPTCVEVDTTKMTHVRLGLVTVKAEEGSIREQVVWLECLS